MSINKSFLNLEDNYVFRQVSEKLNNFKKSNPDKKIINLGIGDVTLPIVPGIVDAIKTAIEELKHIDTMKGYGPYEGYEWLREKIKEDYESRSELSKINLKRGISIKVDKKEVFIGNGSKEDINSILNLFYDAKVLITSPAYPIYFNASKLLSFSVEIIDSNENNNFLPMPNKIKNKPDLIFICSPNNPTGSAYRRSQLKQWVDFAVENSSIILYDGAYESFVEESDVVRSIYEIPESRKCAIEFRSFSKFAGFTGLRCSYVVIPEELKLKENHLINIWNKLISIKNNGVSYITQRGAESVYDPEVQIELDNCIRYYKNNAAILSKKLKELNFKLFGYENSPYIWVKCFKNLSSWDCFNYFLKNINTVITPGCGFGRNGEGYFRISCFANNSDIIDFLSKIKSLV